jgi:hypothetical protein
MKLNKYATRMNQYLEELRLRTMQYKIDFVSVDIRKDFDQVLQSYLVKRENACVIPIGYS